ncbi:MAG: radical SAM protein [Chloroflexi bacterium]|nr:radical SAM protein [Chloroflexota bacterium]
MADPERESGRTKVQAAYLALGVEEIRSRAQRALANLARCTGCARVCRVDRLAGPAGPCQTGRYARVSTYFPHFGEEPPLSGKHGSGTVFFGGCNLGCVFCQNHEISHGNTGILASDAELAAMMLELQALGCHNINLVSPSHVVPQFLAALALAVPAGLRLPIVYNTGGYDSLAALRLLDGIVDIYMPDAKYDDDSLAERFSGVPHYARINRLCLKEMHRQVGDLRPAVGVANRGLLVRHLVLPEGLAGTAGIARFLAAEVSRDTYLNVMAQYRPCYLAAKYPPLHRPLARAEYAEAVRAARTAGLWRGFPEV